MRARHAKQLRAGIRYGHTLSDLLTERMINGKCVVKRHDSMSDLYWAAARRTILNHFRRRHVYGLWAIPRTDGTVTIHALPSPGKHP